MSSVIIGEAMTAVSTDAPWSRSPQTQTLNDYLGLGNDGEQEI